MLAILSPAKNMHRVPTPPHATRPMFLQQTETLAASMKRYAPFQLESVLKVNPQLALRAFTDIQDWNASIPGSPALLSYHGLAYSALDAATLSREDLTFAQDTLRILSAFYGVLRPLDNILPHRLDFESSFRCCGKTMYEFWGSMLHDAVFQAGAPVINLSSAEYSKAVSRYLRAQDVFITCDFLEFKHGKWCMPATHAKMARGKMARFIVKNRLTAPEQLSLFEEDGYCFSPKLSTSSRDVFSRS